jgi:hypothetical protein
MSTTRRKRKRRSSSLVEEFGDHATNSVDLDLERQRHQETLTYLQEPCVDLDLERQRHQETFTYLQEPCGILPELCAVVAEYARIHYIYWPTVDCNTKLLQIWRRIMSEDDGNPATVVPVAELPNSTRMFTSGYPFTASADPCLYLLVLAGREDPSPASHVSIWRFNSNYANVSTCSAAGPLTLMHESASQLDAPCTQELQTYFGCECAVLLSPKRTAATTTSIPTRMIVTGGLFSCRAPISRKVLSVELSAGRRWRMRSDVPSTLIRRMKGCRTIAIHGRFLIFVSLDDAALYDESVDCWHALPPLNFPLPEVACTESCYLAVVNESVICIWGTSRSDPRLSVKRLLIPRDWQPPLSPDVGDLSWTSMAPVELHPPFRQPEDNHLDLCLHNCALADTTPRLVFTKGSYVYCFGGCFYAMPTHPIVATYLFCP